MLIDRQKMELNKKDIYENVRRDVMRKQTLYSSKNLSGSTPVDTNPKKKKVYTSIDHYYHNDNNSARVPDHNYQKHLKNTLEYHNLEHDYKVLRTKQRIKEENEMMSNEIQRLRQIKKNHRLTDYGANVEAMRNRINEYKQWLRGGED